MRLADDILRGAGRIAEWIHGSNTEKYRRKVYYAHEKQYLPIWNEGGELISRKSLLEKHYSGPPAPTEAAE